MNTTITTYELDDSRPHAFSILERLFLLVQLWGTDPGVRAAAVAIIRADGYRDGQTVEAANSIRTFVQDSMRWVPDPIGTEFVVSPVQLLEEITADGRAFGDCDDFVCLFCALARSLGLDARPVGVRLGTDPTDPERFDHVIASIRFPDRVRDYDVCAKMFAAPQYLERLVV